MIGASKVSDILESKPRRWAKPSPTVSVDVLSHPTERRGKGEARSPVLWRASHGSVGEKTGRFGAPALKAGFVTDRRAKPACPLARPAEHRRAANEQERESSKRSAAAPLRRDRRAAITLRAQRPDKRSSPASAKTAAGWLRVRDIERARQRRWPQLNESGRHARRHFVPHGTIY